MPRRIATRLVSFLSQSRQKTILLHFSVIFIIVFHQVWKVTHWQITRGRHRPPPSLIQRPSFPSMSTGRV
ncbi:unnamed protein product [Ectocarpus sp. CCAP 1310/34]|nr:unnamed protein product [Ectocarpus sp. CCAP 1310/34]